MTTQTATPAPGLLVAREQYEQFVRWTIERERDLLAPQLPEGEREAFLAYYRALPSAGNEPAIRRYLRGLWRGESGWTARWLACRTRPQVMDAGSGFGTFAMLYAAVGADVTGADLRPDRLAAAERRLAVHREATGERLSVRYLRADLTQDWDRRYDLVWVYNALSHIDPLDKFLAAVRRHLTEHGVLVIGDLNGANRSHQARLAGVREDVHQEYVAPDGRRHAYAVERTFAPGELRDTLAASGLRVVHHELYWGGMSALPGMLYHGVLEPLQRMTWLQGVVGRRQLVVAARDSRAQAPAARA